MPRSLLTIFLPIFLLAAVTACSGTSQPPCPGGAMCAPPGDASTPEAASPEAGPPPTQDSGADASSPEAGPPVEAGTDAGLDGGVDASDAGAPAISVLTQHNDLSRTGANLNETTLTTSNVNVTQFGLLRCLPVDDQIYAQPLIASGVALGGGVKNVLVVATVNDSLYAFDADAPAGTAPIWQSALLNAGELAVANTDMTGACGGQYTDFTGRIGIVGTPVIDLATQTIYALSRSKANGNFFQRLHAIDLTSGQEKAGSPVTIAATVAGTGDGATTVSFDPLHENQRTAMLLAGGVLYMTWSGHCDWPPYHGWIMGYDATTLKQVIAYNDTPNGGAGGIWMGGGAPAVDATGNLYVATANGTVGTTGDATDLSNRAESFLKLVPNPPSFTIASWFTPWDFGQADDNDIDFGITGVLLVPNSSLVVSGAKSGELFIADRNNMGGLSPLPVVNESVQALDLPLVPNPGIVGFFGTPTFWESPDGPLLYAWGSSSSLVAYRLDPGTGQFLATPVASGGTSTAAPLQAVMLSLSANGSTGGSGIVWATHAVGGNPNQQTLPGILRAFDAEDVSVELWNSSQNAARDAFGNYAKFGYPTIANGHVYVPTFSQQVCIYGLLAQESPPTLPAAPANVVATATGNTTVNVTWTDTSGGTASFVLERAAATGPFSAIGGTLPPKTTTFADTGLTPYGTYEYRLRATVVNLVSDYSNTAQVVVNGGAAAPALSVSGNSVPIPAGSTTPSTANLTDFGAVATGGSGTSTFAIANPGAAPLTFSNWAITGPGASAFALTQVPTSPLAAGGSSSLVVTFTPPTFGDVSAAITITSNDPTNPTYSFAIQGAGIGSLVGWWKLNDGAGQVAFDSSGYEDVGALGGPATFVAGGPLNGALLLSGFASVEVPPVAVLCPGPQITVTAWIYPSAPFTGGANPRVVQKGGNDDEYRLLVEGGLLKFDLANVGTAQTNALPIAREWTHLAGTYDGATITLWVNGVAAATAAATGLVQTTTDSLVIGGKQGSTAQGDYFQGAIDDVRVYARALSGAEIGAIASAGADAGAPAEAGAVDASTPTSSFANNVQPIFSGACLSCHVSPGPAGGLDLSAGHAYASLVNVVSTEEAGFDLVKPGDANDSYLYAKVAGGTSAITITGAVMPQGGSPLSAAQLSTLASWIGEGAQNN